MTADATSAFLHVPEDEAACLILPDEWRENHDPERTKYWLALKKIYGRRGALCSWVDHAAVCLVESKCEWSVKVPNLFYYKAGD
eukprot:8088190-Alexandrium_andersonii.AAC.1